MKLMFEITGIIADKNDEAAIMQALKNTGVSDIEVKTMTCFDDWRVELSTEPLPGLSELCLNWIRCRGTGGGDRSTEDCISGAIKCSKSDIPANPANVIYNSVVNYSKTPFEAAGITMEMINGSVRELIEPGT